MARFFQGTGSTKRHRVMTLLFLDGWHIDPGGVKPSSLQAHGRDVINPNRDDDDFYPALHAARDACEASSRPWIFPRVQPTRISKMILFAAPILFMFTSTSMEMRAGGKSRIVLSVVIVLPILSPPPLAALEALVENYGS